MKVNKNVIYVTKKQAEVILVDTMNIVRGNMESYLKDHQSQTES